MTRSRPPLPAHIGPQVDGITSPDHNRGTQTRRGPWIAVFLLFAYSILMSDPAVAGGKGSPALLAEVVSQRANQLATIDSDEGAVTLFATTVGPPLGLNDAAGALGAKRLPSKMVKELRLAELSQSVYGLMAALAAWQLADSIMHGNASVSLPVAARQEWLKNRSQVGSLSELFRLQQEDRTTTASQAAAPSASQEFLLTANRTVFEASQKATAAWWDIYGWRDRIRQAKGQARLCGTWQWIIHNHQIHGEQKSTIIFPPPGQVSANAATPAEIIVLGDAIYLRWEQSGHIQEDSLLFIKDDAKIEGSFVNNTGGWGAITGKRTAACQP
jgi:hypothetical protein